jgi:hypothetical protein
VSFLSKLAGQFEANAVAAAYEQVCVLHDLFCDKTTLGTILFSGGDFPGDYFIFPAGIMFFSRISQNILRIFCFSRRFRGFSRGFRGMFCEFYVFPADFADFPADFAD